MRGDRGTTEVRPTDAGADGLGRSWALPLPAGTVDLNIVSNELMMVSGNGDFGDFTEVALASDLLNVGTKWNKTIELNTPQVVHITTTTDAQLMLSVGEWREQRLGKAKPVRFTARRLHHHQWKVTSCFQIQTTRVQQLHGGGQESPSMP